ncbi:hypothetical protein FACS1894163_06270 [Spirochaetia bacterium]|nr:hypothetical protein FACS1894163_06270 [Spirochaetia bacterium]
MTQFNHIQWLKDFRTASKLRTNFKELRADIFKQTVQLVQAGCYDLDGKIIKISNDGIAENTLFYECPQKLEPVDTNNKTVFSVIEADCLETAELLLKSDFNPCVLNMASRQNPGGGVLNGAGAQEENVFRRTNLFVSLYQFASFAGQYGIKKHEKNYPLNQNTGGIYSPGITVFRSSENNGYSLLHKPFQVSFVSVPAINRPELEKTNGQYFIIKSLVEPTKEKIRTILRIVGSHGHDSLVLSAFGCGAFSNPPNHMALLFREVFTESEFVNRFKFVTFAIIDDHNAWKDHNPTGNVQPFFEVFDSAGNV